VTNRVTPIFLLRHQT